MFSKNVTLLSNKNFVISEAKGDKLGSDNNYFLACPGH
jgi:hypothetical protein